MPANSRLVTDLQFAMTCLNNANGGVINFQAVAQQCGMPTAAAAGMKLWLNPPTTSASPKSGAKRQGPGKKISNKRKQAASANEDDNEDVESPKNCKIDGVVKKEDQEDETIDKMGRPSSCKVTDVQFLVSCMNNTENGKVNTSKVKNETGMASISAVSTKLNKIKAENTIAGGESTGDDGGKQSSASAGGKKKGAREGGGKDGPTKKRKLAEVDDAEQETEGVKKEQMDNDDD
ncbi:hypothetical protein KC331_g2265 [Hortaea werneckii]|nr:hypothetical protein KC331_g2265 [Hortaea werneckii]KAI7719522.1 hypothetical protein KC353_g2912 [Hortaea werneckii]